MKIGIDMDEVIADWVNAVLNFYHAKTGKKHYKEEFKEYKLWPVWGISKEEAVEIVDEFHEIHKPHEVSPIKDAIDAIKKLGEKHEPIIITGRPIRFKHKIHEWLEYYFGKNNIQIIHAGDFHKGQAALKAEICKEKFITVLLEDAPETALDCVNSGIKIILFDQPWNRDINLDNITRVYNWQEALSIIERLEKEHGKIN